jgi:hypothetical protein
VIYSWDELVKRSVQNLDGAKMIASRFSINAIPELMDQNIALQDKLISEWNILNEARLIFLAAEREHFEFDTEAEMKEAMARDFNPFNTFSVKKKRKKKAKREKI